MEQIGVWRVTDSGPVRVSRSNVDLEQHLEQWIASDPSLLQAGLTIVGQQIDLCDAGRLDLLALDQQGQWVVIEIKRGMLYRDTVAQAIDYASAVATMPYNSLASKARVGARITDLDSLLQERQAQEEIGSESREVRIVVVGTGQAPGLQRMVDYLSDRIAIEVVSFQVFELADGDRVLVREVLEHTETVDKRYKPSSMEVMLEWSERHGIGPQFRMIKETGERHNLHLHRWRHSLMLAPQANKSRCLLTVWATPVDGDKISIFISTSAFAEFFGVSEETAKGIIGFDQWQKLTAIDVQKLVGNLDRFFGTLEGGAVDSA